MAGLSGAPTDETVTVIVPEDVSASDLETRIRGDRELVLSIAIVSAPPELKARVLAESARIRSAMVRRWNSAVLAALPAVIEDARQKGATKLEANATLSLQIAVEMQDGEHPWGVNCILRATEASNPHRIGVSHKTYVAVNERVDPNDRLPLAFYGM